MGISDGLKRGTHNLTEKNSFLFLKSFHNGPKNYVSLQEKADRDETFPVCVPPPSSIREPDIGLTNHHVEKNDFIERARKPGKRTTKRVELVGKGEGIKEVKRKKDRQRQEGRKQGGSETSRRLYGYSESRSMDWRMERDESPQKREEK